MRNLTLVHSGLQTRTVSQRITHLGGRCSALQRRQLPCLCGVGAALGAASGTTLRSVASLASRTASSTMSSPAGVPAVAATLRCGICVDDCEPPKATPDACCRTGLSGPGMRCCAEKEGLGEGVGVQLRARHQGSQAGSCHRLWVRKELPCSETARCGEVMLRFCRARAWSCTGAAGPARGDTRTAPDDCMCTPWHGKICRESSRPRCLKPHVPHGSGGDVIRTMCTHAHSHHRQAQPLTVPAVPPHRH